MTIETVNGPTDVYLTPYLNAIDFDRARLVRRETSASVELSSRLDIPVMELSTFILRTSYSIRTSHDSFSATSQPLECWI